MILFLHFCRSVVIPMMMTAVFIGKCSPSLISGEEGKMGGKKRTQVPNSSKQITRYFFSLVQLKLWYMKKMYVLLLYTTLNILIKIRIETMNAFPWWHILVKCHMFSNDQKVFVDIYVNVFSLFSETSWKVNAKTFWKWNNISWRRKTALKPASELLVNHSSKFNFIWKY